MGAKHVACGSGRSEHPRLRPLSSSTPKGCSAPKAKALISIWLRCRFCCRRVSLSTSTKQSTPRSSTLSLAWQLQSQKSTMEWQASRPTKSAAQSSCRSLRL
eukprot:Amastigsp_a680195_6.p8 type:complete len:102 gc:universal Amastigsp_a680195_6:249-554(+)